MKYICTSLLIAMLSSCCSTVVLLEQLTDNPNSRHVPFCGYPSKKITAHHDLGFADTDSNQLNKIDYTISLSLFTSSTPPVPFALHVIMEIRRGLYGIFTDTDYDRPLALVIDGKYVELPVLPNSVDMSTALSTRNSFQSASYQLTPAVLAALKSARVIEYKFYSSQGTVGLSGRFSQENLKNLANHPMISSK